MRIRNWVLIAGMVLMSISARAERFVLVGSWQDGSINRYRLDGSLVGKFVSTGSGGLSFPDGMAYGTDGNLYVSDASNARVLRYNGSTGAFMGTFATGGLQRAGYSAFGPDGMLYVCSNGDNAVHRFDPTTGAWLGAFASVSGMKYPAGLAWIGNTMYVSGFQSGKVYKFDATSGASQGALTATFRQPLYVRAGLGGNLYVSEYGRNSVARYNLATNQTVLNISNQVNGPVGQAVLPDGTLLIASWNWGIINKYDEATGALLGTFASGFPMCNDLLVTPDIVPAPSVGAVIAMGLLVGCRRRR